jgi:hypothetical protein
VDEAANGKQGKESFVTLKKEPEQKLNQTKSFF